MDPYQYLVNKQADHLGVNKTGKNIKKSPVHQPTFATPFKQHLHPHSQSQSQLQLQPLPQLQPQPQPQPQLQPQPHVYNINKSDFRELVQKLTGSPFRDGASSSRPPQNYPRAPNNRLQRVRPPPLAPTLRPQVPVRHYPVSTFYPQPQPQPMIPFSYSNTLVKPPPSPPPHVDQLSPGIVLPPTPTDVWTNTAESPVSVYMRYLQNSVMNSGQSQPDRQAQIPQNPTQHQPPLLPSHGVPQIPSTNPPPSASLSPYKPALASPGANASPLILSPTSQFLLSSPTGFWNLSSSPLPPLSPSFSFLGQSGNFGAAAPRTPSSPGYGFSALSPSGLFPVSSPRWWYQ